MALDSYIAKLAEKKKHRTERESTDLAGVYLDDQTGNLTPEGKRYLDLLARILLPEDLIEEAKRMDPRAQKYLRENLLI